MLQQNMEKVQSPNQEVFEWERESRRQKHRETCSHGIHMNVQSITIRHRVILQAQAWN